MPSSEEHRARWPRFRLSTFLLAVAIFAVGLGWWTDHRRQVRRLQEADILITALHEAAREDGEKHVPREPSDITPHETVGAFLDDCFKTDLASGQDWEHFWPSLTSLKGTMVAAESVPELVKLLHDPDTRVRERAAAALGVFAVRPDLSLPALADAIADPAGGVRQNAVIALGYFGPDAASTVPALLAATKEASPALQGRVARSLWCISRDQRAIEQALQLLRSDDAAVRADAVLILSEIGPPAQSAVLLLAEMLSDEDTGVSLMAIEALLSVAPKDQSYRILLCAFPRLTSMPRRTAAFALRRLDMELNCH